jgi:upstream activation factor subunit UAF30
VLTGIAKLSRPETTKRLWAYIKSNDLQDPSDKRFILCDSKMREVFRQDKVHMFTMTKLVSQQMYNPEE